jgi:hypothetical protein
LSEEKVSRSGKRVRREGRRGEGERDRQRGGEIRETTWEGPLGDREEG